MKLRKGKRISREDGLQVEEWVGPASTGTESLSLSRVLSPPGWAESPQTPAFDQVVIVLRGELTLVVGGKRERIGAGETGLVPKGQRVLYRNEGKGACDYYFLCAPGYQVAQARLELPVPKVEAENWVTVQVAHPQGKAFGRPLTALGQTFLSRLELGGCELSVSLVGDRAIRRLNRTWRKKDKATDVLSFPAGEAPRGTPGPRLLGDIVISLDTARRQSKEEGRTLPSELARYLAHGLLHLLGHDHEQAREAKRMAQLEEQLLGESGMVSEGDVLARRLV